MERGIKESWLKTMKRLHDVVASRELVRVGLSPRFPAPVKWVLGDLRPVAGTETGTPEQQKSRKSL